MALQTPRDNVSYEEVDPHYTTLKIDASTITWSATATRGSDVVDRAVKLVGDDTVELCGDGDPVYGRLDLVEPDGKCSVQDRGYCQLPGGNGATLTVGAKIVGALNASSAKGFIKALSETVSSTPTQAEVQNAFKAAKTHGEIVNNDTTTAVWVYLR